MSGLMGLMSRIRNAGAVARDNIMPSPGAVAGLLSPEEINAARSRGLLAMGAGILNGQGNSLQAISQGVLGGQEAYGNAIGQSLQAQDYMQQRSEQQKVLRARAEIASRFSIPENANESQRAAILQQMMIAYAQAGDTEMAGKIGEVVKSLGRDPNSNDKATWQDFGGYKALVSPDGTELKRVAKTPTPRDPNAPDSAGLLRMSRTFNMEDKLADDFNKDTKSYREIHQAINNAISEAPRALQGDAAAQVNLLYAFVKAMDPNSAVREGEIGLVNAATPIRARAQALITKYMTDGSVAVPAPMVRSMAALMKRRSQGIEGYVNERRDYYTSRARRSGLSTDLFPEVGGSKSGADFSDVTSGTGKASNVRQFLKKK